ncbi:Retron-type reverse transcriptase [Pseudooceanicola antarcticus]|uniref:Retron-type reverse transcriptase n=1 Tax=Pseudooceanicola antarcticus TaxID=1247613 RepID=A0A285HWN7_9RHOB|nr:RNA-directed DNA polymerase [Pseudooceanicola antarcticus]PJE27384.1 hypothetical protein CVM39_12375 [Pseudooceanicola antarcticus]SNY40099.1 Retron-type reverse transcriptase [Pseudooceanicola antarcticus]
MPGLSGEVIDRLAPDRAIKNIQLDIRSDFILAPHFNAIFNRASDDLWSELEGQLRSGNYNPVIPLTMNVPKEGWFSRPGSILAPLDRLAYQLISDDLMPKLEEALDRNRTFSHFPSPHADEYFISNSETWEKFQERVQAICSENRYVIKADISHYFERLPQHHLINLMNAAGAKPETTKLLEEILLAFQQRNSFGIIQGVYPSDLFGNFYLSELDAHCELMGLDSARYVDDFYIGLDSLQAARFGMVQLVEHLRKDGLHLNEGKSKIFQSEHLLKEETEIDRAFDEIRMSIWGDLNSNSIHPYGFEADWEAEEDESKDEMRDKDIDTTAAINLLHEINRFSSKSDQIERFVLPLLGAAGSDAGLDHVLTELANKPHNSRIYFSYIKKFAPNDSSLRNKLEKLATSDKLTSDYQKMFLLAAMMTCPTVDRSMVNKALTWMRDPQIAKETRAMCAIFCARKGSANQKRTVRTQYENEASDYVRSAILYASRHFKGAERRTCKIAWGGHSTVNSLIAKTI